MTISIIDRTVPHVQHYKAIVTLAFAKKHDNGALISCGWAVGENLPVRSFRYLVRQGRVKAITEQEYNHSGCQSSCILRGNTKCTW